jgi:hypothetical protein
MYKDLRSQDNPIFENIFHNRCFPLQTPNGSLKNNRNACAQTNKQAQDLKKEGKDYC